MLTDERPDAVTLDLTPWPLFCGPDLHCTDTPGLDVSPKRLDGQPQDARRFGEAVTAHQIGNVGRVEVHWPRPLRACCAQRGVGLVLLSSIIPPSSTVDVMSDRYPSQGLWKVKAVNETTTRN